MQHANTLRFCVAMAFRAVARPSVEAVDSPIGSPVGAVLAHPFEWRGLAQIRWPSERGFELVASLRGFLGVLSRLPVGGDVLLSITPNCEDDDMGGSERFADCLCGRYWDSFHGDS